MKGNRRPQASKNARVERVQGIRSSNAAGPHKPSTDYKRRPKHIGRGWDA